MTTPIALVGITIGRAICDLNTKRYTYSGEVNFAVTADGFAFAYPYKFRDSGDLDNEVRSGLSRLQGELEKLAKCASDAKATPISSR
jgi:hypothetical protein